MVLEKKIRVMIIDDYEVFRDNLRRVIVSMENFEVVGEAGEMAAGLSRVLWLKPDLVTVDISLPDQNGIELTREIKQRQPDIHVLVITIHSSKAYIGEAIRAGANGYLLKTSAADQALGALQTVAGGGFYGDPTLPIDWTRLHGSGAIANPALVTGSSADNPLGVHLKQTGFHVSSSIDGEGTIKIR